MIWQAVGDQTYCTKHLSYTPRGVPCAACVADPKVPLGDREYLRTLPPKEKPSVKVSVQCELKLMKLANSCNKIASELLSGKRGTINDRTEPAMLAAKFLELAARGFGRVGDMALKREEREELDTLRDEVRKMRASH